MKDPVLPGNPPIPLILRRSARARRISLRISQLDGRVTLTMPKRLAEREALAFAESKQDWIRQHLAARGEDVIVAPGAELPVLPIHTKRAEGPPRAGGATFLLFGGGATSERRPEGDRWSGGTVERLEKKLAVSFPRVETERSRRCLAE